MDLFNVILTIGIGIFFLHYANRAMSSVRVFRSVFWGGLPDSQTIIDDEPIAVEGDVVVDRSAYAADRAVENTDSPVGAYLWRAAFSNRKNVIDFKNRTVREGRITFESGVESGQFGVASDNRPIRVDPTWLVDVHDGTLLSDLTVSGTHSQIKLTIPLWESPCIHLTSTKTTRTLDRVSDLIDVGRDVDLEEYYLEAKPIYDGTTVAVYGKLCIEQGEPVIRGSDTVPLVISDDGFDGLRRNLKRRLVKHGVTAVVCFSLIIAVWHYL